MDGARLRKCLTLMRWSQRELAGALGCDPRLVRRWAADGAEIPDRIADWLETLAAAHSSNRPPTQWRSNSAYPSRR